MATPSALRPLIRRATEADVPQIHEILSHYVDNTVVNFRHQPPSLESEIAQLHDLNARGFPYLAAVPPRETDAEAGPVLGYANAHPFRGAKEGYAHTVEMTIFVRPEHAGKGRVGGALMEALIDALQRRGKAVKGSNDDGKERRPGAGQVRIVLACMSVDSEEAARDAAIVRFYKRWGFVETGRMKSVGWKFERWIDTRYLELDLWDLETGT